MESIEFQSLFAVPLRNGIYKAKEFQGRGVRLVKMNQLFSERILRSQAPGYELIELTEAEKFSRLLQRNDLLFSRTSVVADGVGKCSIVDEVNQNLTWDSNIIRVRLDPFLCCPNYYFYFFNSPYGRDIVKRLSSGAAITTITGSGLSASKVPYPSILEQQRVAAILSAYDELIENSQRRIKILEAMARNLYREWFVHFRFPGHENQSRMASALGEIPQGWEVKKLKDVCSLTMGQSPKSEFYNDTGDGLPFHQGVTNFGDRFPSDKLYCTSVGRVAETDDILFSVRAPVGRMNFANKKIILGRGLSAIRHKENHQAFLWEQLGNKFTEVDMIGNGAIFASVTKDDMQSIDLVCPPSSLVEAATKHFEPIHSEVSTLSQQIQNLRRTRDLLLPRLLSGQINVEAT